MNQPQDAPVGIGPLFVNNFNGAVEAVKAMTDPKDKGQTLALLSMAVALWRVADALEKK